MFSQDSKKLLFFNLPLEGAIKSDDITKYIFEKSKSYITYMYKLGIFLLMPFEIGVRSV